MVNYICIPGWVRTLYKVYMGNSEVSIFWFFCLKIFRDLLIFISSGTRSQILGAKNEMLFIP